MLGNNSFDQLGTGSQTQTYIPANVIGLTAGVTAISAGYIHSCAIVDGGLKCWEIIVMDNWVPVLQ